MKIWVKSLIALILGITLGIFLPSVSFINDFFKLIENLFFKFLLFLSKPMIFISLIIAFYKVKENNKIYKIFTIFFPITIGFAIFALIQSSLFGFLLKPGEGLKVFEAKVTSDIFTPIYKNMTSIHRIIPETFSDVIGLNPASIIPTILISLIFGVSLIYAVKRGQILFNLIQAVDEVLSYISLFSIEIFSFIIFFSTYNLVKEIISTQYLLYLIKYIIIFIFALFIQSYLLPFILVFSITKTNPVLFFKSILGAQFSAFALGSVYPNYSNIYYHTHKNLGIDENFSSIFSSLGVAFNIDGAIIFTTLSFSFFYQLFKVSFISYFEFLGILLILIPVMFIKDSYVFPELPILMFLLNKVGVIPLETVGLIYIGFFLIKRFSCFITTTSIITINYLIANKFFNQGYIKSYKEQI
ncbi:MAG: dicarboxylate/amino acid:cation symporter [Spirochaetes bacterium]|nr:dicarboxylate/amino acid:cation symporter [Spirochaetota bacterium]